MNVCRAVQVFAFPMLRFTVTAAFSAPLLATVIEPDDVTVATKLPVVSVASTTSAQVATPAPLRERTN